MNFIDLLEDSYRESGQYEMLLTESVRREIADDVDYLYERFLRDDVKALKEGVNTNLVTPRRIPANAVERHKIFVTNYMRRIHRWNPVDILIGNGAYYRSTTREVGIGPSVNLVKAIRRAGGIRELTMRNPNYMLTISNELTALSLKSIIYHELAHYIDDTVNNGHMWKTEIKMINAARVSGNRVLGNMDKVDRIKRLGARDVYLGNVEIEAMIHEVYNIYRHFSHRWDMMSWQQLIDNSYGLKHTYYRLMQKDPSMAAEMKQKLLKRMHREGLLGKVMR